MERIVAAAIQYQGITISLPKPARHGQVMHVAECFLTDDQMGRICEGFLTSEGRFVTRVEAKHIAHRARQPILRAPEDVHHRDAFSEDFW
jgi:hypothetical protein